MEANITESAKSYIVQVREYVENFFAHYNINARDVIRYTSCFGAGFLLGLLCKRILKFVVMGLIILTLVLTILYYFELIGINFMRVQSIFGLENINSWQDFIHHVVQLVAIYWIELFCVILGWLIGYKVG
jgi:ABC-type proline/glycine betaine transport system permease subunit